MSQAELKTAIRKMIQVELDAMHYYQQATTAMQDEGAVFHFNLLADEELEHARSFYQAYPDSDISSFEEIVQQSKDSSPSAQIVDEGLMARLDERQALQLAMKMEQELEGNLRKMAEELESPLARSVVEKNAESTRGHFEMIEADYQRLYGD